MTPQLEAAVRLVDDEVLPVIHDYWERAEFPRPLVEKLAGLGIVGDGIEGYGCSPMSPIATASSTSRARTMTGLLPHATLHDYDGHLGLISQAHKLAPMVAEFLTPHNPRRTTP